MRYNVDCGLMTVYRYQRFLFFSAQDLLKQNETSQFLTFIYVYLYIHTYIIIFKEVHHVLQRLLSRFLFHRLPPPPPPPPSSPPPPTHTHQSFRSGSDGKKPACNAGDPGSIPRSGRSSGEGNGSSFQYSCL